MAKNSIGVSITSIFYLLLGIIIFVGFIWLVITDFEAFTFSEPYNAGDVEYSVYAQDFMVRYALGPIFFVGGILAIPGSIILLFLKDEIRKYGYYLILFASVMWTLPVIGLIVIWYFLSDKVKSQFV